MPSSDEGGAAPPWAMWKGGSRRFPRHNQCYAFLKDTIKAVKNVQSYDCSLPLKNFSVHATFDCFRIETSNYWIFNFTYYYSHKTNMK
jgi:hypothetical protein